MEFLENDFFLIALTFGVYYAAKRLQAYTGWVALNPILVAILVLIGFLKLTGLTYAHYAESASIIDFWLKPAIVALGVPLYLQLKNIRRQLIPLLVSQLVGCFVGIVSVVFTAKWLGASDEVIISLAPKSVTTPIAMEVTQSMGGIPSLTAAIVVLVGLFGAVFGFKLLQVGRPGVNHSSVGCLRVGCFDWALTQGLSGAGSPEATAGQKRLFVQRTVGRKGRLDFVGKKSSIKKRSFRIKQFPNPQ